ncbi:MAG: GNAT family N-acetyltransferase [Oligoflexia bacterium]|nr:GNAT family N-acetyltransferase [Oligoflexia bacterium]MBF0366255.1 GNAT family N-acetyltransferase [Oligoflexia bacterium]
MEISLNTHHSPAFPCELQQAILALDQEMDHYCWSIKSWQTLFHEQGENYTLFTLTKEHTLVSMALFFTLANDKVAHLLKIVTSSKQQGQGHAKRVLTFAMKQLLYYDFPQIYLEVGANNSAAISLYQKLHFRTLHRKKSFYSHGEDAVIMFYP